MKIFTNGSTKRRSASIFRRSRAPIRTASGRTSASVAEVRSLTTIANVSLAKSAEKTMEDCPTLSGSSVSPMVTPKFCTTRVLLLASESSLEVEVRTALQAQLREDDSSSFIELVCLDITPCCRFFVRS